MVAAVAASGLLVLGLATLAGASLCLLPLFFRPADDMGNGLRSVILPAPRRPGLARLAAYLLVFLALALAGFHLAPEASQAYQRLVAFLAGSSTTALTQVRAADGRIAAELRVVIAFSFLSFAAVLRATWGRRLVVAAHAGLFVWLAACLDALTTVLGQATGLPLGPYSIEGGFATIVAGTLVLLRMLFTTLQLPRPTVLSRVRPSRANTAIVALLLLAVAIVEGVALLLASQRVPVATLGVTVLFFFPVLYFGLVVLLFAVRGRPRPPAGAEATTPAIDVIIPAYNEEAGIALTLASIDRAARRYGGPVRVVVGDDGSTDRTAEIIEDCYRHFTAATGTVVPAGHQGKAAALNRALDATTAPIVVRIDADVVIHEDSLRNTPRWFADPAVGMVGALMLPREDVPSFFQRMRTFECLMGFAFTRLALGPVDGVNVIPGTYAAFLREHALSFGGHVEGMNGEDADLTMMFARLGLRAIVDPEVLAYEDVPPNLGAFIEQRTRWNRSTLHVFGRHDPFVVGSVGPRLWYSLGRAILARLTSLLRPLVLVYSGLLAILDPTSRHTVLILAVAFLLSTVPSLFLSGALAVRHGYGRRVALLPGWFLFAAARRVAVLSAILSIPTRPVGLPAWLLAPGAPTPAEEVLPLASGG